MRVVEDEDLPGSAMDMFYPEADDDEPSLDDLLAAPPGPPAVVGEHVTVAASGAEVPQGRQPVRASRGRFEVTSRDRLYLLLSVGSVYIMSKEAPAKDVLKELPMEFAVEAQKLLAISLEGSVG